MLLIRFFTCLIFCVFSLVSVAQQANVISPWSKEESPFIHNFSLTNQFKDDDVSQMATAGTIWHLNQSQLAQLFSKNSMQYVVNIPLPDGTTEVFKLTPTSVMSARLADKYPDIHTFKGVQVNDEGNSGRFDYSPNGFSGMFKYNGLMVMLANNKHGNQSEYISYYAKDEIQGEALVSSTIDPLADTGPQKLLGKAATQLALRPIGEEIRTYRVAISATAEYTIANGGEASAMAEIVRLVNRINEILLSDLAIQFELVDENDRLIFTNPDTDPFTNSDSNADLDINQDTIDDLIGPDNYDIGHVLSTNPGGIAQLVSACKRSRTIIERDINGNEEQVFIKGGNARGLSGKSNPRGESFYIQLVIHEFGHQMGAEHTFNALDQTACDDSQRSRNSAVEPGSGSTIMSYAGLCGEQNLQGSNDGYFHAFSIEKIQSYLATQEDCGVPEPSGNNIPNITTTSIQHTIPTSTPFVLTANVTDDDGDQLTYAWDQVNPGGFDGGTASRQERETDSGENPLFRSNLPSSNPTRYFPKLSDVLNGSDSDGEVLPTQARQLDFELVVRDGRGGVNTLSAGVNLVDTGGVFAVTKPLSSTSSSPVEWTGGTSQDVEWNTADTELAPISCNNVDILLDADGNDTFETTLANATENDGLHQVISPNTNSDDARIMVKCTDSIFYAVNPGAFTLLPGAAPIAPLITGQQAKTVQEDTNFAIELTDLVVQDPDSSFPGNFSLQIVQGANYTFSGTSVTPANNFSGDITVSVFVNDGISDSNIFSFVVQVSPVNDTPSAIDDAATVDQDSNVSVIDVLSNDSDPDQDNLTISEITYSGSGQATISNNNVSYMPAAGFSGSETIIYTIQDPSFATDSATLTISVTAAPVTPPTPTPTPTPAPSPPTNTDSGGGGSMGQLLTLILLALLVSLTTGCSGKMTSHDNKQADQASLITLSIEKAEQDAKIAAEKLDFRALGLVRKLISLPGIDQSVYTTEWVEKHCGIRILRGVTDTVEAGQDLSYQNALRKYAEAYNRVIFKSCLVFQKDYSE